MSVIIAGGQNLEVSSVVSVESLSLDEKSETRNMDHYGVKALSEGRRGRGKSELRVEGHLRQKAG